MAGLKQGSTLKGGKYKIVKTLGQGSFGITYLATTRISMDGQLGKMDVNVNVTIKEFFMSDLNSRATDGTSVERTSSTLVKNYLKKFRKEAENLAKLHHPNIVKVLEVFDENNTTYYVMEYVDGETIDEYIKSKGHLSESESLKITQDVCSALSYMHEHKMLHLDLKPKNIMRNSEGRIFLIDFGLAKQYTEDGEPESSTSLGLGTPGYAPIEQAHYKKDGAFPVTLDIYALGASLYKMLTGKTPPDSSLVLNDGLPLSKLKSVGVSEETIAIVEKAMAPMKKERYQSVKALSLAIGNFTADEESTTIQEEEEGTNYDEQTEYVEDNGSSNNEKEDREEIEYDFEDDEQSFFEKYWKYGIVGIIIIFGIYYCSNWNSSSSTPQYDEEFDTLAVDSMAADTIIDETIKPITESAKKNVKDEKKLKEGVQSKQKETNQPVTRNSVQSQNISSSQSQSNVSSFNAGAKPEPVKTDAVFDVVEEMPSFPGGASGLMAYLGQNIKYPVVAEENGIQGRVIVTFVVERDGSITDVKVVKSVDPSLDKEAVRVIKIMPRWKPGKQNGAAVRVKYTTPVTFRLQ